MVKTGLGRITEDTPQYQGVIVYSMVFIFNKNSISSVHLGKTFINLC